MDRTISSTIKDRLFGTTWKDKIQDFLESKITFNNLKNIEIYLPFTAFKRFKRQKYQFEYLENENRFYRIPPNKIFYMILFMRDGYNKKTFGIELTTDIEVVPQLINRKKWYIYEWNKKQLTIRRTLGTTDPDKIEKMAIKLLDEYKRFYFMYCKE